MENAEKLVRAFELFDHANAQDPNMERLDNGDAPKELVYAKRMSEVLDEFAPDASQALRLTARCQHIRRWEIPRDSYPANRAGYLRWRQDLKRFHADKARDLLAQAGFDEELIGQVEFLLLKKQLKKNEETQTLEDVICLVFLKYYFDDFLSKHPEDKIVDILQKTWRKMSPKGHKAALAMEHSSKAGKLLSKALNG